MPLSMTTRVDTKLTPHTTTTSAAHRCTNSDELADLRVSAIVCVMPPPGYVGAAGKVVKALQI